MTAEALGVSVPPILLPDLCHRRQDRQARRGPEVQGGKADHNLLHGAEAINKTARDDSGDEGEAAADPMKIFSAPCFPCLLGEKYSAHTNKNRQEAKRAAFTIALMAIIFVLLY